ncbi:alpha/beta fold hydrolase [Candidatus Poriferisocius sp.]|uniref:alpha/beta fold hydrolase n=1 Tax=Candidatus Poriferisocius sp. TaxID=3101276 RepID=UPI003B021E06
MHLNEFASTIEALNMTVTAEFESLCTSAADLGIAHSSDISYVSRNIVARHHRFHFLEWGSPDAQTVLLLHGGNQSAHSWDLVSLALADRYHVLALDQRGHGDSEWARDADYSSGAMAADVAAFCDALGVANPIIMGHSMGGMNTMRLCLVHPNLARAIVIVDVGPEISEVGTQVIRTFVTENREFQHLDDFVAAVQKYDPYRSREHIERTVKYNLLQRVDGTYISKVDHGPRLAHGTEHRRAGDHFTLEDAGRITQPALLLRGADSWVLTAEAAERFAEALPDGRLVTVADCSHNVHGQNTPGFLAAVEPFLKSVSP